MLEMNELFEYLKYNPFIGYCAAGFTLSFFLLFIPTPWLTAMGKWQVKGWRPFCPNMLSIGHVPLIWAGFAVYKTVSPFWGFMTVIFGAILDRMDGKVAAALGVRCPPETPFQQLNFPGFTPVGEWLDPAADKAAVIPLLVLLTWWKVLYWPPVVILLAAEGLGTLIRLPSFKTWTRKSSATALGKIKATLQWVVLIVYLPYDQGWVGAEHVYFINILMGVTTLFAVLSILSRLKISREVGEAVDGLSDRFKHK